MDPSVSVPRATGIKFAATATADPQLDPLELLLNTYALLVLPPRPLTPIVLLNQKSMPISSGVV